MNNWLSRIPNEYRAYLALLVWGGLVFISLNKSTYGLDEGAAHALLLVWSVADGVVSPIVTLGLPDFRSIFFIPTGILWTGNVLAAKLATMLVMSVVAWAFYTWRQRNGETEGPLLATGILLISPLVVAQIDTMSVAPFLLITFALGAWADKIYRDSKLAFGGMYFAQIFLCLVSVTLHPLGLAYPLALLWTWHKNPLDREHRNNVFFGIIAATLIALILTLGWHHVDWLLNPLNGLASLISGPATVAGEMGALRWVAGVGMLIVLALVVLKEAAGIWADFLGRILMIALAMGLFIGDEIFAAIALTICLYWGLPLLLKKQEISQNGFWGQRGIALLVIFVISTTFMINDRMRYESALAGVLSPRDTLIKTLAEDGGYFLKDESVQLHSAEADPAAGADASADPGAPVKKPIRVASQWPGLTMLACRCDALPLPPEARDSAALLAMMRGVDYLIFDPRNPANSSLSHNLANMDAGQVDTVALQQGGVIVLIRNKTQAPKLKT